MIIKRTKNFSRKKKKKEEMIEINKRLSDKGPITKGIYKLFKLTPVREKDGSFSRLRSSSIDKEINLNGVGSLRSKINNKKFFIDLNKKRDKNTYGFHPTLTYDDKGRLTIAK